MASYNALSENIDSTSFDSQKILRDLDDLESTLTYLKSVPANDLSNEIKSKIHHLVTSFEVLQCRLFRSSITSKVLEELWEGQAMLKYLFEKCILHYEVNNRLKCSVCDDWIEVSREQLKAHLESNKHVRSYSENVWIDRVRFWRQMSYSTNLNDPVDNCCIDDDKCLILKYGKFINFEGPNDLLFCKLCCIGIPKTNNDLLNHFKERSHQEMFKEIVSVISDNVKFNIEKSTNKNIFANKNTASSQKMNFNNMNLQKSNVSAATSSSEALPYQSSDEDVENSMEQMKVWMDESINTLSIKFLKDEISCQKFYMCCICRIHTTSSDVWERHCISENHLLLMENNNAERVISCSCSMEMVCPREVYVHHINSNHKQVSQLLGAKKDQMKSHQHGSNSVYARKSDEESVSNSSDDNNHDDDDDDDDEEEVDDDSSDQNSDFNSSDQLAARIRDKFTIKSKTGKKNNMENSHKIYVPPVSRSRDKLEINSKTGNENNSEGSHKNLLLTRRPFENDVTNANLTAIGLTGIPESAVEDDLIRVTQHFGSIRKVVRITPETANLYIVLRDEFRSILHLGLTVKIEDSSVKITHPIPLPAAPVSVAAANGDAALPHAVRTLFSSRSNLKKLMEDLLKDTIYDCETGPRYSEVITDVLRNVLLCPVECVGSRALKIVSKESALDLFIEIDDNYFGQKVEVNAVELSIRTTKIYKKLKSSNEFNNVRIEGDNVQVIWMQHSLSGLNCRIFCKDGLVVEKTELSRIYLDCDIKIRQMVLVILHWFKLIGLENLLPTYSILWMSLFSLIISGNLHPIIILRNNNDGGRKIISGWDCRYSKRFSPKMKTLPPLIKMLYTFFEFYGNTDNFENKVLAPLTGEKLDNQRIRQKKLTPPYSRYCHLTGTKSVRFFKLTKGLCLQDPLQLNYNITVPMQGDKLATFVQWCRKTLSFFDPNELSFFQIVNNIRLQESCDC